MPEFSYKATTRTGQTVEGLMEGKDEETVIHGLHQLGYIPIRIAAAREKGEGFSLSALLPQRVGIKDLLIFTQELTTLISAGLPIDRSLNILGTLTENRKLKETVKDLLNALGRLNNPNFDALNFDTP